MDALFGVDEPVANPQLLVAAREARGWTQAVLVERLSPLSGSETKVSQGYISRVEKGLLALSGERLALFATALQTTPEFLTSEAKLWALGEGCLYHRNRRSTKASTLRWLHARINLLRLHLHRLADLAGTPLPGFGITSVRVGGMDSPEDAARGLRAELGLPAGAIESVTEIAERLGALVVPMSLGSREVDASSLHPPGEAPVFVINTDAPTDRQRFTLAHEIGHCVCAPDAGIEVEEMAQAFAGELLAPSREVRAALAAAPVTPARLLQLKPVWRMSAAALLRRAVDLAVITHSRYRSINAQISALGWQTAEPEPLPPEQPVVVPGIVRSAVRAAGSVDAAAEAAGTTAEQLCQLFGRDVVFAGSTSETVDD
jgi:Zn-dependent peptidase ImmA (M78 family)/transcriptional regulator with XRE-family HTH domain